MKSICPTSRSVFLVFGLLALCGVVPIAAQEEGERTAPPRIFVETVNVDVVNVDVYVRDKEGNPITGLTKDDFEMEVDGRPVAISNFYAVNGDRRKLVRRGAEIELNSERQQEAPEAADPEPDTTPPPPPPPTPEQELLVVVYIDNFNLTPFNRNRVMRELRAFLRDQLSPDDRIMLATYDRFLNLRQPFTNNPQTVNRELLELEDESAQRIHRNSERNDIISNLNDVELDNNDPSFAVTQLMGYVGSVFNDMNVTVDALHSVVENLAASPGRKALVYVSDGVPMIAGEDMFHLVNGLYENSVTLTSLTEYDLSGRFRELSNKANANRVSFYTIDARGLTVNSQGTVDQANAGIAGQASFIDQIRNSNMQSPLQMLAEETGGRAIINTNKFLPDLQKIATDFDFYYSLGYTPAKGGDGRYHDIKVKLKNKPRGTEVRHRSGYRDKSIESQMVDGTLSALHLNLQLNPIGARIIFGPPEAAGAGTYKQPMIVAVPWESLTLIPRNGIYQGSLRLWVVAKDEEDKSSEPQEILVDIAVPEGELEEAKTKPWGYKLELNMEGGYHDVAIGVRDDLGATKTFLREGVRLPSRG